MRRPLKTLERRGRELLKALVARLFPAARRCVTLPKTPRVVVVRLDERVGNLVMLTPLLRSLRARLPEARIDVLVQARGRAVLGEHPAIDACIGFDKRRWLGSESWLGTLLRLRGEYDLAVDAGNPTAPSVTQSLWVRFCGATHSIGSSAGGFGALYTAPVDVADAGPREIDMRLSLLRHVPGTTVVRRPDLPPPRPSPATEHPYVIINLGARLPEKQLGAPAYAALADAVAAHGLVAVLTWGPVERQLAEQTAALASEALLAPPTTLTELMQMMAAARAIISCDTGPMHIGVALGVPTCAVFVSTDPSRYAYPDPPHGWVDARCAPREQWLAAVDTWLAATLAPQPTARER